MLVLTRNQGTAIYGGVDLTPDLEGTFEHKIEIVELGSKGHHNFAMVCITFSDGKTRAVKLDAINDSHDINNDVGIYLLSMRTLKRDGARAEYQARIGIDAPLEYRVVRDDAIKKAC